MKIAINPLDQVVKRAERRINLHSGVTPQHLAHDRKRQLAQAVLDGAPATGEFARAAAIEGVSPQDLAKTIVAKPDVMMEQENFRRSLIVAVRNAKKPEEVEKILADNKVWVHPEDAQNQLL